MRCHLLLTFYSFYWCVLAFGAGDVTLIKPEQFNTLKSTEKEPCEAAEKYRNQAKETNDSSYYHLDLAYRFAENCDNFELKTQIAFQLGQLLTSHGEHILAKAYLDQALNGYFMLRDTSYVAKTYKAMGVNYKYNSQFIEALESFNRAAEYFHSINDKEGIATIELNIGLIHKNMRRFDEAKVKYHSALKLFTELGSNELMADCQNNLGNVFKNEENYDSAFYYMYVTLASREKYGPDRKLGFIYHNLANLHLNTKNIDSAKYYVDQSIELKNKIGNMRDLASDYTIYGDIYLEIGDNNKAIAAFEKARELYIETANLDLDYETSLQLATAYYEAKNYRKAAENYQLYFTQRDSLRLKNDPLNIENEFISYEFLKDSIETEKIRLEQELQEAKYRNKQLSNRSITNQLYFISGLVGLLILMIVLLFISFRKRLKQGKEHQEILALQNEELKRTLVSKEEKETLLKEIHHRVKNNLQIISSLIRLQSGYINESNFRERLNEIENRILSMSLIHEKLYQSNNLSKLEVKSYIRDLCINILESYQIKRKVKFVFDIDSSEFNIDTLIPMGLILNEVVSNALKHAFHNVDEGQIRIDLKNTQEVGKILIIKDNGNGSEQDVETLKEDSLGMELIFSLTDQLDGELEISTTDGFEYRFYFPDLI